MEIKDMSYKELQAEVGKLGIKSVGVSKAKLIEILSGADTAQDYMPEESKNADKQLKPTVTSDLKPTTVEPPKSSAPPVDQNTAIALMAAQMAKEAMEKLGAVQAEQKKPSTPEKEIAKRRESDKATIARMPRQKITMPGGYPGAPKEFTSCVNGHLIRIQAGESANVPIAHIENFQRSWKQQKANQIKAEEAERKALAALAK